MIPICETFTSLQGEVQGLGRHAFFIRTFGCNLGKKCPIDCDTPYSWKEGINGVKSWQLRSPVSLKKQMIESGSNTCIITGGEPMLHQEELADVIEGMKLGARIHLEFFIETNGTIDPISKLCIDRAVFFNVSPKMDDFDPRRFPLKRSVFKHVVDPRSSKNLDNLLDLLHGYNESLRRRVFVMPLSRNRNEYHEGSVILADWCIKHGLNFGPRLHLSLWDGEKGR